MKWQNKLAYGLLTLTLFAFGTAGAWFWDSEPEPTAEERQLQLEEVSNAAAESLKRALQSEWEFNKGLYAAQAAEHYADSLEENLVLKQAWQDRGSDLVRISDMPPRRIIITLQQGMFASREKVVHPPIELPEKQFGVEGESGK